MTPSIRMSWLVGIVWLAASACARPTGANDGATPLGSGDSESPSDSEPSDPVPPPRCENQCPEGGSDCSGVVVRSCRRDPESGCWAWHFEPCAEPGAFCTETPTGVTCQPQCPEPCEIGEGGCASKEVLLECAELPGGCTGMLPQRCPSGWACENAACVQVCVDEDGDGYGVGCEPGLDCLDDDGTVHPEADDLCGDDIDQDCSGRADDPAGGCGECEPGRQEECWVGFCSGVRSCVAERQWGRCDVAPSDSGELCDGLDNDCNGRVDDDPGDAPTCACGEPLCVGGRWRCPQDATRRECACGQSQCEAGAWICALDRQLDQLCESQSPGLCQQGRYGCEEDQLVCRPELAAGVLREVCDGRDEDCDGSTDEDFAGLGETCPLGVGACAVDGLVVCSQDQLETRCDGEPGEPAEEERCWDGLDDDCDGMQDEGCPECARDEAEVIEAGCLNNDGAFCSGQLESWHSDCDDGTWSELRSALSPEGDEDWFYMLATDGDCEAELEARLTEIPEGMDYELCVWWVNMDQSDPAIVCREGRADTLGDMDWNHFDGARGCCSVRAGNRDEHVLMSGNLGTGRALFRIWPWRGQSCAPYLLQYHY